jgi:hypothetical protein
MKIGWTPKSIRTFKKLVRKNPQLRPLIEATLELLSEDCFNPSLRTHIKSSVHRPVLISLFSSFASFAPSRLNHSDATGNDITNWREIYRYLVMFNRL